MGAKIDRPSNPESGGTEPKAESTSTRSTSSRGRGRGAAAAGGSSEKIPKATLVEVPNSEKSPEDTKKEEQRKAAAARKRKSRAAANSKKNASPSLGDATQLKILLLTTSQIIAAREGMQVWAMTEQEVDQIVTPLYSILSKNDGVGQVMGEYADHIALIVASFTIFVPKFMMWKASRPKKEGTHYARKNADTNREQRKQTGEVAAGNRPSGGQPTNTDTTFGEQLYSLIPPSAGI